MTISDLSAKAERIIIANKNYKLNRKKSKLFFIDEFSCAVYLIGINWPIGVIPKGLRWMDSFTLAVFHTILIRFDLIFCGYLAFSGISILSRRAKSIISKHPKQRLYFDLNELAPSSIDVASLGHHCSPRNVWSVRNSSSRARNFYCVQTYCELVNIEECDIHIYVWWLIHFGPHMIFICSQYTTTTGALFFSPIS